MVSPGFLKDCELAEPIIRKLYDSKLRLAILDALKDGPMRLADLKRAVDANAPNTSSKAKELEEMGIVERTRGDFQLTNYGRATLSKIEDSLDFYATYEKFKSFWNTHETVGIPDHLFKRLGELKNSEIVLYDPVNIKAVEEEFFKLMRQSKRFWRGLLTVVDPQWTVVHLEVLHKPLDFEFIITPAVVRSFEENREWLQAASKRKNVKFFIFDGDPRILLGVFDNFLDMALNAKTIDSHYWDADLFSLDPKAVQWGLDLFEYYKKQSKPINLADYL
jgi:predicted transcriptional regulator